MIDDGGGTDRFYGPSGKIGVGPANGKVLIRFCGFSAGPGTSSWTDALRVGRISSEPTVVAKSVTILNTGFFGERTKVGVENVGWARVEDCNSARLVQTATQQGVNTTFGSALLIEGNWIPNINQGW